MHLLFKLGLFLVCFAFTKATEDQELKCNLRFCGAELLNFEKFTFSSLFRKLELASFCVKNCTPPVIHEFFQSIIFGITKRIPGHCSSEECVDKNRFVALAKCVEGEAWPLLQCSKKLIDLAHIGLVVNPEEAKRNTTCDIVTSAVQCIEESLQRCGEKPFQLVKEILGDLIKIGISAYCHPEYRKQGWFIRRTTSLYDFTGPTPTEGPGYKHPQFVKGYRQQGDSAPGLMSLSHFSLLTSITLSIVLSVHLLH